MKHGLLLILLTTLLATLAGTPVRAHPGAPGGDAVPTERTDEDADGESYTLSAAYPNPFLSQTRFDLRVDERQRVSVEVYNILGQRVRTLYEGTLSANRKRTFTFRAGTLPSGLYLYRIKGETFTAARRVTLVR